MKARFERRRIVALTALVCISAGSVAGLATGLVSCTPADETPRARPLSVTEARRLAEMRAINYRDGRVGIRATVGKPGAQIQLAGWVDWQRPIIYLAATGPVPGPDDGLLQAVPGIVATRPGRADGGQPPAVPPADGWRVRPFTAGTATPVAIDSFLALLFAIASEKPAEPAGADLLVRSDSRWIGNVRLGDQPVDVFLGPALPPQPRVSATPASSATPAPTPTATRPIGPASPTPAPGSLAAMGGAVRYWLDGQARLHRFEALLSKDAPVTVELRREERPELVAIDALGGRVAKPRRVTAAEAATLAKMRQRNRATGGGEITLTVPMLPAGMMRARGWLDWRRTAAYFGVYEVDKPEERALIRADRTGVSVRKKGYTSDKLPPLPPPAAGWEFIDWSRRVGLDLDILVNEALAVSSSSRDDAKALRKVARWLRTDTLGGTAVTVYEIPKAADVGGAHGQATIRYWVDGSGGLRRLELRTRTGAFGQLDIAPGDVPAFKVR